MNSELTDDFIECFKKLPLNIKALSRKNYKLWLENPNHPGLNFKKIKNTDNIYSIRIGLNWRALGVVDNNTIIWFWIGSHSDYNSIINKM